MSTLFNPEWAKRNGEWVLASAQHIGKVAVQIARDYSWAVFGIADGGQVAGGTVSDYIEAFAAAEAVMGYKYLLDPEYEMDAGCRCGSCTSPTGRWIVSNRADTVEEYFNSEGEAVAWILEQHGSALPDASRRGDE